MRKISFVLATVLFCAIPVFSQVEIILDEQCGYLPGGDVPANYFTQDIYIQNPNDTVWELCVVMALHKSSDIPSIDVDPSWSYDVDSMFGYSEIFVLQEDSITYLLLEFGQPLWFGAGIQPSEDPIKLCNLWVSFAPFENSEPERRIWFDSTAYDTLSHFWHYNANYEGSQMAFSGPPEYRIAWLPNTAPIILEPNPGGEMWIAGPGCTKTGWWWPHVNVLLEFDSVVAAVYGPGQITRADLYGVQWEYTPAPEDAGQTFQMYIGINFAVCGEPVTSYFTNLHPYIIHVGEADTKPEFVHFQQTTYIASVGEPLEISFELDDPDPEYNTYRYYVSSQDPEPPATIDPETGVFTFLGSIDDTATYWVNEVVEGKCGAVADTIGFFVYLYTDPVCGDANHNGNIDLSDLIWITNYMFMGGVEPVPLLSGDVNCDSNVDLSDLIGLVNYLFMGGAAPCADCP
ncbi:MAG: dockerin type I domain-containing protein [candidate division Zixibacteria bacterium]|jgi:hypothetical protein|nr:dockerin type I domain-containing protein [candidate division Zixibacteria bacterium]